MWWKGGWPEITLSVVPNLLGFTLGAMAIVLAFPSSRLFSVVHENGREDSFYIELAARFVHFIFVQVIALLVALIGKAYEVKLLSFLGAFFLVYAVVCAGMTALSLFGIAQINNHPNSKLFLKEGGEE